MAEIAPIVIVREAEATPDAAWAALTDPALVARWFTDATPVGDIGAAYRLDFGDGAVEGVVTESTRGRRLGYTWAWAGAEPRQETLVGWEVEPLPGARARVTLRHDGWAEAGADGSTRDDHAGYWEDYLDALVEFLAHADVTAGRAG